MSRNLSITKARTEELPRVLEYVQEKYMEKFGTIPEGISGDCFIAKVDSNLCGVICISTEELQEIIRIFQLDFSVLPGLVTEYVSCSRWISEKSGVGALLARTAFAWALKHNKRRCLCSGKPNIIDYLRKRYMFRMDSFIVPLRVESIRPEHKDFYLTSPQPGIYVGELESWYYCLNKMALLKADIRV